MKSKKQSKEQQRVVVHAKVRKMRGGHLVLETSLEGTSAHMRALRSKLRRMGSSLPAMVLFSLDGGEPDA